MGGTLWRRQTHTSSIRSEVWVFSLHMHTWDPVVQVWGCCHANASGRNKRRTQRLWCLRTPCLELGPSIGIGDNQLLHD